MTKKIIILSFCFISLALSINTAQASFGVSPTYIKTEILRPGTLYERRINLLRSSADEDLEARITVNAPGIESWISINGGTSFILPKGELRIPATIKINVPPDAELGHYGGEINVSAMPVNQSAGVAISEGALIELNLTVTNQVFSDFKIREVKIPEFAGLGRFWNNRIFSWLLKPLKVVIRIENTGNVEVAPSNVVLDIYGVPSRDRLASFKSADIGKIKPYETREITVSFPVELGVGQYWGRVKIYKGNEVLYNDQIIFTIAAPGSFKGRPSWLKVWPLLAALTIVVFIAAIGVIVLAKTGNWGRISGFSRLWSKLKRRIVAVWLELKFKFWRWLRFKSGPKTAIKSDQHEDQTRNKDGH